MAEPERGYFPPQLPTCPPEGFSRLYFGAEFCYWRFPDPDGLKAAYDWCRTAGWAFTLVTPVLNPFERDLLAETLRTFLPRLAAGDEFVLSDWGALELVRTVRPDLTLVIGRALSGQKRGPRILSLELSDDEIAYFRQGSWYSRDAAELLTAQGIRRVELDNLLQRPASLPNGLCGTLHLPYLMVTSSRNCPYRPVGFSEPCPAPCGEVFTLETAETGGRLLQAGNTQFLENPQPPEDLAGLGIDRVVHHPQLPA